MIRLPTTIESERLILQKYSYDRQAQVYDSFVTNEKRLYDSFPISLRMCTDDTKGYSFIHQRIKEFNTAKSFGYAIVHRDDNKYIGHFGVINIEHNIPMAELAYFIDATYEGRGFISEAMKVVLEELFIKNKFEKINLRTVTSNLRSIRTAEVQNFTREGCIRKCFVNYFNKIMDVYTYGLTREDYDATF